VVISPCAFQRRRNFKIGDYCKFWDRDDPYLLLRPLKVEVLLEDPVIHVYHDVVSHDDIEGLKKRAKSQVRNM
jgi:hypothetical protein